MRHGATVLLSLAMLVSAVTLGGDSPAAQTEAPPEQIPGTRIQVRADGLPPPYATPSAVNRSKLFAVPLVPPFRTPAGFSVNLFAGDLTHARALLVASNGDVLLVESKPGRITLLRDTDDDGVADTRGTFVEGFKGPFGIAIQGDYLYIADTVAVWQIPYRAGDDKASGPARPITARNVLGDPIGHWTRSLVFSPDGSRFFVGVGSTANVTEDPSPHATIQSFGADGQDQKDFATGLRNPVGIAFYPGTDDLYAVVNERDNMGDGLVPDFLTRVEPGGFYGWPYSYIGKNPQPKLAGPADLIARAIVPDVLFRAHSAPLGLVFYEGQQFPERYRGDAFVALHGSWNSSKPTGYMVARVPFEDGKPQGYYESFLTGFWMGGTERAYVFGRPAGLAVAKDGALLVADDGANAVWRVSYGE